MELPNRTWQKLTINPGSGFTKSGKLVKGETIIQKDLADGIIKIYTPQNEYSNILPGDNSWHVKNNDPENYVGNKYFNVTISEAFDSETGDYRSSPNIILDFRNLSPTGNDFKQILKILRAYGYKGVPCLCSPNEPLPPRRYICFPPGAIYE